MDRSLWLLLYLRGGAWLRGWRRILDSVKGVLLAVVGVLIFSSMLATSLLMPRLQTAAQVDAIRLYGPLGLLAYCLLNVLMSAGDRALYYSPGEVAFLFTGPYRPRQLLVYKAVAGVGAGLLTTPFLMLAFRHHSTSGVSVFVGLFLTLEMFYLFSIAVGLVISTVGALAFGRARRVLLFGVLALAAAALSPFGRRLADSPPRELIAAAVASPALRVVVAPFRPFVEAFTAPRVWPDLAGWASLAVVVDLTLFGLVLALNAQFLEASASASARLYEKVRRLRRGEAFVVGAPKVRFALPMAPWCGGAGPNVWRQLTTASRSGSKVFAIVLLFMIPVVTVLFSARDDPGEANPAAPALVSLVGIALFAPTMVGFDFRSDLGRIEVLKALPIRPTRLVLGQLVTGVMILTAAEWLAVALVAYLVQADPWLIGTGVLMVVPVNLVIVAVENLYFLWFPFRLSGFNTFDFQAMGRQMLLLLAKFVSLGVAAGLATGSGFLVSYFTNGRRLPALAAAWVVLATCGLALIPVLAQAFQRFDVSESLPE